jgi:hypothetical protein
MPAGIIPGLLSGVAMGLGYTTGAYAGYGGWNTADPWGIHNKKRYKHQSIKLSGMAYGMSGYGSYRRRYRYSRFRRYRRYSRFSRYRRRSYYRRRYY